MLRFVRRPGGEVVADPCARRPGRGAYLCPEGPCEGSRVAFARSFRAAVTFSAEPIQSTA